MTKRKRILRHSASAPDDEYYTLRSDVEYGVKRITEAGYDWQGRIVYSPCDKPVSQFVAFFTERFTDLGLAEYWHSWMEPDGSGILRRYTATGMTESRLDSGDWGGADCMRLYAEADLVATNPPFSSMNANGMLWSGEPDFLIVAPWHFVGRVKNVGDCLRFFSEWPRTGHMRFRSMAGDVITMPCCWMTTLPVIYNNLEGIGSYSYRQILTEGRWYQCRDGNRYFWAPTRAQFCLDYEGPQMCSQGMTYSLDWNDFCKIRTVHGGPGMSMIVATRKWCERHMKKSNLDLEEGIYDA